jgi:hypothetical protein
MVTVKMAMVPITEGRETSTPTNNRGQGTVLKVQ